MSLSDRTFPKTNRLLKSTDYQRQNVLTKRWEVGALSLLIRDNPLDCGRLGIIASRKNFKTAVVRNRIKRITRESFRHHKSRVKSRDVIVIAKKGAESLSNEKLRELLDKQWLCL